MATWRAYLRREFYVLVDYLALLFSTGDATYRQLYVGEKVKQAYWDPESSADEQHRRRALILQRDHDHLIAFLKDRLPVEDLAAIEAELHGIQSIVTARARYTPKSCSSAIAYFWT